MTLNEALGYPWNSKGITTMIHQIFKEFKLEKDYIGKKDINDKKIYSDCSIVEFEYPKYEVGTTVQDGHNKHVGYFKFNENTLSYMIYMQNKDGSEYRWHFADIFSDIKNIKIIDTIQKNKLGLIK